VKALYGRGKHDAEFEALKQYFAHPNPDALILFIADHIGIPADPRRMELTDKDRYQRIRETLASSVPWWSWPAWMKPRRRAGSPKPQPGRE